MDIGTGLAVGLAVLAFAIVGAAVLIARSARPARAEEASQPAASARLADAVDSVARAQAELAGRLAQLAEAQSNQQIRALESSREQERFLERSMEDRMAGMARVLSEGLEASSKRQGEALSEMVGRLGFVDAAQRGIDGLNEQVGALAGILSNKQARGAWGEAQLMDIVREQLPPSAYEFQVPIGEGRRVDCLLRLPGPPGSLAIDAKFPLEPFIAMREASSEPARKEAAKSFAAAICKHVKDISEKYIVPGVTADQALMFIPSEAVFAEIHANFRDVVEKACRARVWIVSPTTLMATITTMRAVMKDSYVRGHSKEIQGEVVLLSDDMVRLSERVEALGKHFEQAQMDLRNILVSASKIAQRGDRISAIECGDEEAAAQARAAIRKQ